MKNLSPSKCRRSLRPASRMFLCCGLFVLLYSSSILLFGQSDNQDQSYYQGPSQNYNQSQSNGQSYSQVQNYNQGQFFAPVHSSNHGTMQISTQSISESSNDPSSISVQRVMQILKENPDLANECKSIVMNRLMEEGRMPPGGQLSPEFLMDEIKTDSELKSRLLMVLQQRGLLASDNSSVQSGLTGNSVSNVIQEGSGNYGNDAQQNTFSNNQLNSLQQQQLLQAANVQQFQPSSTNENQSKPWMPELSMQPNPYGNLHSLQDLYTQIRVNTTDLERFGLNVFRSGTGNTDLLPVDLPAGPDYVLGSGDGLNIHIWGGVDQELSEVVDRTGRIALPEIGSVMVATKTLTQAQECIRRALSVQFKNTKVDVSLARVRTVRIYVVGDVQRPGAYDISSLSTPLNALYAAGGPTDQGSLRLIKHYRSGKLVANVDLYDLLLNGVSKDLARLESGDTILVPPVGPQVTVAGMVRRPAIYELTDEIDLARIIELAGGLQVSATLGHIRVDRIEAYKRHITLSLRIPEVNDYKIINNLLFSFHVQDGDRITISPLMPYSEGAVYLEGHVYRPGKHAYEKGMRVSDLIHSYHDLLPEPSEQAEIIRLMPPDYRPIAIQFQLSKILMGTDPLYLQPFDTIRIFGRYEIDPPKVTINGEVLRPGEYPMARNMTASDLVRFAGGFRRSALLSQADISSYVIKNGVKIVTEHKIVQISEALNGNASADVILKPYDVVTIRKISGWDDIGASVTLGGEVVHPGTYGIGTGEKLSSLIKRAGGFRKTAFPEGAVLERVQVKELAEKSQQKLIDSIETQGLGLSFAISSTAQDAQAQIQAVLIQQKQVLQALRSHPPSGRLVINISADISKWENTASDIEVRDGDEIAIPKNPEFVVVNGQVYNPSAMTYVPGRTAEWYLRAAGGFTELANKRSVFIIHANGSVVSNGGGVWHNNVMSSQVHSGDMIIAPEKIISGSAAWHNLINAAQVTSGLAIAARVATSF